MEIVENIRNLYRGMEWADARMWQAIFRISNQDAVLKQRVHHLHMVQQAFLNAWRKVPHTVHAGSDLSMEELARWSRQFHKHAAIFLGEINEESLDQPLVVPWAQSISKKFGREPEAPTIYETFQQVALHTVYHRGQVNVRIRDLGGEPLLTDFIVWLWLGKPAPEWPVQI